MYKYFTILSAIANKLAQENIPFILEPCNDGWRLVCPWADGADIAVNRFTFGSSKGRVESYKFPWDNGDVSILESEEAFRKIRQLWREYKYPAIADWFDLSNF